MQIDIGLAARGDLAPGIETVFLIPSPLQQYVSSSLVREIAGHGGGFERYVPVPVAKLLSSALVRYLN